MMVSLVHQKGPKVFKRIYLGTESLIVSIQTQTFKQLAALTETTDTKRDVENESITSAS